VVALAGSLSSAHVWRDAFQEVDQQALFRPVTKKTWTATQAARIPEMVREAFTTALAPRRGPVVLNLPRDLLAEVAEIPDAAPPASHRAAAAAVGDPEAVRQAANLLASARRPLIVAGGGIKNGREHARALALAQLLGAPVALSPGHGDAVSCEHPLYAGQVGPRGNAVASQLAREADVILALGTRLGFNTTFYTYDNLNPEAKIVQVDQEHSAVGRFFPIAIGIVGDAGAVAGQLAAALAGHRPAAETAAWTAAFRDNRRKLLAEREATGSARGDPIQPASLYHAIRVAAPADAMFTMDAGTLCLQATDQMPYRVPPALFTPLDFGLVGFSYAAGLGIKLACPERPVVSLMGDGGFGMTVSEIGTAVAHGINTVCIVMNNGCWGAEKAYQRDFFDGRYIGADVPNPPYDRLAELYGAAGFRVDRAAALEETIRAAIACGKPAIVDVQVDPEALYSFRRDSFKHRDKAAR
jgi:acetolactate synthase-1/2/3 large subunit/sulfoacetaldehyde acetyltransferase